MQLQKIRSARQLRDLAHEHRFNPLYQEQLEDVEVAVCAASYIPMSGDGACFYRALGVGVLRSILFRPGDFSNAALSICFEKIVPRFLFPVERLLAYVDDVDSLDVARDRSVTVMKDLRSLARGLQLQGLPPHERPAILMNLLNADKGRLDSTLSLVCKLKMCQWLDKHHLDGCEGRSLPRLVWADWAAAILGLQGPSLLSPREIIRKYCEEFILPSKEDACDLAVYAAAHAFQINLVLFIVDGKSRKATRLEVCPSNGAGQVCLLFRPGHYDLLLDGEEGGSWSWWCLFEQGDPEAEDLEKGVGVSSPSDVLAPNPPCGASSGKMNTDLVTPRLAPPPSPCISDEPCAHQNETQAQNRGIRARVGEVQGEGGHWKRVSGSSPYRYLADMGSLPHSNQNPPSVKKAFPASASENEEADDSRPSTACEVNAGFASQFGPCLAFEGVETDLSQEASSKEGEWQHLTSPNMASRGGYVIVEDDVERGKPFSYMDLDEEHDQSLGSRRKVNWSPSLNRKVSKGIDRPISSRGKDSSQINFEGCLAMPGKFQERNMGADDAVGSPTGRIFEQDGPAVDPPIKDVKELNLQPHWSDMIPYVKTLRELTAVFGGHFLLMISVAMHLNKGFCNTQAFYAAGFLVQNRAIVGPRGDVLISASRMPWAMKPLIALLSDTKPIRGYKKLPYMLILSVVGVIGVSITSFVPASILPIEIQMIGIFCGNAAWSCLDILMEGLYSRRLADNAAFGPQLVTFVWAGMQLFGILPYWITTALNKWAGSEGVWGLLGGQWALMPCVIPLFLAVYPLAANWMGEVPVTDEEAREHNRKLMKQKELIFLSVTIGMLALAMVAVNLLSKATWVSFTFAATFMAFNTFYAVFMFRPVIGNLVAFKAIATLSNMTIGGTVLLYFFTSDAKIYPDGPHFSMTFYKSAMPTVASVVSIIAIMLYGRFCKAWRYRSLYLAGSILMCVLTLPNSLLYKRLNVDWGISDYVFVIADDCLSQVAFFMLWMPAFLILSRVCPKNVESTVFAMLAAGSNFGQEVATSMSSMLASALGVTPARQPNEGDKYKNLWIMNLIAGGVKLVPILFLWLLPPHRQNEAILAEDDQISATIGSPYQRIFNKPDRVTEDHKREEEMKAAKGSD